MTQLTQSQITSPDHHYRNGAIMVIICGLLWSTAGVGVRYISEASGWHIVFFRSVGLIFTIFMVMAWHHKGDIITPLKGANKLSFLAGIFLGCLLYTSDAADE